MHGNCLFYEGSDVGRTVFTQYMNRDSEMLNIDGQAYEYTRVGRQRAEITSTGN
jgi:hypothetical protein